MRNLKTNFYTYAGVVQALEGVSFDMQEGETLGLVGETGCGKSVTALSILRLIPQPPGRIEEGEVLFDLPPDTAQEIDRLEAIANGLLPRIFERSPEAHPDDLSIRRLRALWEEARKRPSVDRKDLETLRATATALIKLKEPHDLLSKSDEEMRMIRGNQIAMIFQDPMQALNPVFPIGDQIAENILLHRGSEVATVLVDRMDLEAERDGIALTLREVDSRGVMAPIRLRPPPIPLRFWSLALLWFALSASFALLFSLQLHSLFYFGQAPFGLALTAPLAALGVVLSLVVSSVALGVALFRPWSRLPSLLVAAIDAVVVFGVAFQSLDVVFRTALAVRLLVDVAAIWVLSRSSAPRILSHRFHAWGALLEAAGKDRGDLSEVKDLLRRSRLPTATRGALIERLDSLIDRTRVVLGPHDPIDGHFSPWLPWALQRSLYRTTRDGRQSPSARVLSRVPVLRRIIKRPLYDEAVWLAIRVLDQVKIPDPERIARQYPYELSGGMQQRALIAIALSCNPKLLIADEPTTALDVTIQAQILELIRDMKKAFGSSVLLITHDLGIIAEICTRVCVMYAGCIVEDSSVRSVFKESLHPYTQGLMKAIPSHTVRKDTLEIIRGSVPNLIYPPPGCRFHPRCPAVMADCGWSPGEVGSQLWDALREMAGKEPWGFDVEALEWSEVGPTELRVVFPEGTSLQVGVSSLRVAVEMGQGRGRPAFGAIRSVESPSPWGGGEPPRHAVVHILEPRKPPSFVPEPGHSVACLLYEEGMTPFPRGAADAG